MTYRNIVTSHWHSHLSGVAKFNKKLSQQMGICSIPLVNSEEITEGPALVSIKVRDHWDGDQAAYEKLLQHFSKNSIEFDLFLHTYDQSELEERLIQAARKVFVGNDEIHSQIQGSHLAFCPALTEKSNRSFESEFNIFSFGMAHKLQLSHYSTLYDRLNQHRLQFLLWVSTAFHEKANFGNFSSVSEELSEIYKDQIRFLGFVSDEAVSYFLSRTNLCVAFFDRGVRANNTSLFAAMNHGCPVLTNRDQYSPLWLEHGVNVLFIDQLETKDLNPARLAEIGKKAQADSNKYADWPRLIQLLQS